MGCCVLSSRAMALLAATCLALCFTPVALAVNGMATIGQGMGGSCGYDARATNGFGRFVVGVSAALYNNGAACGACYIVSCRNSKVCKPGSNVIATAINICQNGQVCRPRFKGLNLSPEAYDVLATDRSPGAIPITFNLAQCQRSGGVVFTVNTGTNYYLAVLISNVGGSGGLRAVAASVGGSPWKLMKRSYGAVWDLAGVPVEGKSIGFRLVGLNGEAVSIFNALPAGWKANQTYSTNVNLPTAKVPPTPPAPVPKTPILATLGQAGGGSCGYSEVGNPYGTMVAGFSEAIYGNGQVCGGCYRVTCVNSRFCRRGASVLVTATSICQSLNSTSICALPKKGLNLSPQAFDMLATSRSAGQIPVRYAPAACPRSGGVRFKVLSGNNWYIGLLIWNVGRSGQLSAVQMSVAGGAWQSMTRSYGAVWSINGVQIGGKALWLKLIGPGVGPRNTVIVKNALPANWGQGGSYSSNVNFV